MNSQQNPRKFQFIREIAIGGFGGVYLAKVMQEDGYNREVAVKLLHRKWSANEEVASRMRDEARLLGWLRHRNIVDVLDLTMLDGRCAVIMEYLDAVDLREIIDWARRESKLVPLRSAVEICAAAASALDAAYNRPPYAGEKPLRVIHRDIKPSNIMLDRTGLVKVLDFGVARADFDSREAETQEMSFGSLEYMPPERLFFEPESAASDVYSLGTTLYELVCLEKLGKAKLRPAEQARFLTERFEDLLRAHPMPSEDSEDILHDLLCDMLAFDEADRPSAAECVSRMRSFCRELPAEGLSIWAPTVVPELVVDQIERPGTAADSLVGQTVEEEPVDEEGMPSLSSKVDRLEAPTTEDADLFQEMPSGIHDQKWDALKEATLQSLSESGELTGRMNTAALLRTDPRRDLLAVTSDVAFDEGPTLRLNTKERPVSALALDAITVEARVPAQFSAFMDEETVRRKVVGELFEEDTVHLARGAHAETLRMNISHIPSVEPAQQGRTSPYFWISVGALTFVLTLTIILGGVTLMALVFNQTAGVEPVAEQAPDPDPAPVEAAAPAPAPAPPPEDDVEIAKSLSGPAFRSAMPNTRKIVARCGGSATASGDEVAMVPVMPSQGCTITVIYDGRKKKIAKVDDLTAREYVCFEDGEKTCR